MKTFIKNFKNLLSSRDLDVFKKDTEGISLKWGERISF